MSGVDGQGRPGDTVGATACPQAWHGGLYAGLLEECKYQARHRGRHRNKRGDLEWGGELSGAEVAQADKLRSAR